MVIAKLCEGHGYLKVTDYMALNTYTFDIAGDYVADGMREYLYDERGCGAWGTQFTSRSSSTARRVHRQ